MTREWWEDRGNLAAMAAHLVDEHQFDTDDLVYFLQEPWGWDEEWAAFNRNILRAEA